MRRSKFTALAEHGIYFVDNRSDAGWIQFLDFASHGTTKVAPIGALAEGPGGVTLSPDGRTLLYAQRDADDSDIVLLRGFE